MNAAKNLMNALKLQEDETPEGKEFLLFLQPIKMMKYKDVFIDNGIDDLSTILELKEEHLEKMNIPLGHRLKIIKRIKETKKVQRPPTPVRAPVPKQASCATEAIPDPNNLLDGQFNE
jgi:hypothetical protein